MSFKTAKERSDYQLEWLYKRRSEYLMHLGGKCVGCGTEENLEFHHKIPEDKEFGINALLSRKREFVLKELEKCELRCDDCHKVLHATKHGKQQMYANGCRCEICITAFRIYNRNKQKRYRAEGRDKSRKNYNPGVAQQVSASGL